MKAYIGIDVGQSGGIAVVGPDMEPWAVKMPDTVRDVCETIRALYCWSDRASKAALELVHSSPQMGVKSAFSFGQGYGHLEMALTAAGIPWEHVRPQAWQKAMGCLTGGDKNVSKAKAQQLFPSLKITHAIADALLIAEWLRRTNP